MNHPQNLLVGFTPRRSRCYPHPVFASPAPLSIFSPLCFQSLAHSSAIRRGWGVPPSRQPSSAVSVFAFLRRLLLRSSSLSFLESTLTKNVTSIDSKQFSKLLNHLESALTKNQGRGYPTRTAESASSIGTLLEDAKLKKFRRRNRDNE